MLNKKSVDDINVKGKKVLVRCDFNVPLIDGKITDENRLVAALPTIKKLIADGGKVILCSHLGKPKGQPVPELSLAPVAVRLSELLGQEVKFAADPEVVGPNAKAAVAEMKDGDVILLENTRYRAEETKNEDAFSKDLASLCDVFVNDAFGTAHRAHCSNVGVTKYVDTAVVGYLMQKEIDFLGNAVNNPERPFVAILGGAKVSSKISVIENLLDKVDTLIIGGGIEVGEDVRTLAEKHDCIIITTPFDTFSVARLINQSMPIKQFMTQKNIITFGIEDYVDEVRETMSKIRHRDFPILNENGNYAGMVSRRNLMNMQKKQVILVDHNEKAQAVDGIDEAEILEIIDHHRLGSLETVSPVYFRNQPLGCTSTIIYQMYQEKSVDVPKQIAGLLLSAIISDTLMFRSPTCTPLDKSVAEALAVIAEVDIETYAKNMFQAGSNFSGKTTEEIFYQDFKIFHTDDCDFGVAQISAMSREELDKVAEQIRPFMVQVLAEKKIDMVYVMLTDILEESSKIIFDGENAGKILGAAFRKEERSEGILLEGIVSRKKQFIPTLMNEMAERQ